MTTERDSRTRVVLSWLREDAHENAERVLLSALDEVDLTQQRRPRWPVGRFDPMSSYAKLAAAAAAVLVVAVVGYQLLPGRTGPGAPPTAAPSPSAAPLAVGEFTSHGVEATIDARGVGDDVTGTMTMSDTGQDASVALECGRTTEGGLLLIGGLVTDSTFTEWFPAGHRVGIALQPGSPVKALWYIVLPGDPPLQECQGVVDAFLAEGTKLNEGLEPIEGSVDIGP
ncbi:MAG TPA: hypothetical protein VFP56_08585 [Candidatus Limnocylindrales bacterium]|nr:hypothetical protein [Candidatus Limnocylindrales bacterium]